MVTEEDIELELADLMKQNHKVCNQIGKVMRMVADYSKQQKG